MPRYSSAPIRFWTKVEFTDSCWLWKAAGGSRYGQFRSALVDGSPGRMVGAHRWAYEFCRGPIPAGLQIDHLCCTTNCVNPDHLEVVTRRENIIRSSNFIAINARKTHCIRGHEFNEENTLRVPKGRACRECRRYFDRKARRL